MKFARAFWTILAAGLTGACLSAPDLPYPCAQDGSCPDGAVCIAGSECIEASSCNVDAQDCPNQQRCALIHTSFGLYLTACVQPSSTVAAVDAPCSFDTSVDDCSANATCDATFSTDGTLACRSFCKSDSDCSAGETCVSVDAEHSICAPTCTVASGCASGRSCRGVGGKAVCQADGIVPAYQSCDVDTPCAAGLVCSDQNLCIPSCDGKVACGNGLNCAKTDTSVGICSCDLFSDECGDGYTCRLGNQYGPTCSPVGSATDRDRCDYNAECPANELCAQFSNQESQCLQLCETNDHPCSDGSTCNTMALNVTGPLSGELGVCTE